MEIHGIVRQIVDRCHVGDSDESVIAYFWSRCKKREVAKLSPEAKADWEAQVKERHAQNKRLYSDVMSGRIGSGEYD